MLFLLTTLGAGLFISTISHTQQQAMMSSFFFSMPAFMLSGFTFPIRNMPEVVQYLTYLNPLRYFMEIVRGIFLKGTGIVRALAADAGADGLWHRQLCCSARRASTSGWINLRNSGDCVACPRIGWA